ncbi:MAG: hypothetical protein AAGH67_16080 [Cyanobacteria bacterium P01_H01_bin.162]
MTPTEIRQRLHQQIDQLPADLLLLAADFLDFLKFKRASSTDSSEETAQFSDTTAESGEPILTGSTGADLLQFSGTWQGDDFEECLQYVRTFRS